MRYVERVGALLSWGYEEVPVTGDMKIDRRAVETTPCPCGANRRYVVFRHRVRGTYVGIAACRQCQTSEEI